MHTQYAHTYAHSYACKNSRENRERKQKIPISQEIIWYRIYLNKTSKLKTSNVNVFESITMTTSSHLMGVRIKTKRKTIKKKHMIDNDFNGVG